MKIENGNNVIYMGDAIEVLENEIADISIDYYSK